MKTGCILRALLALAFILGLPRQVWATPAAALYTTDSVGTAPSVPAPAAPEGFFSDTGGPDGRGTILPDYWLNKIGGEISNAIQNSGQALDLTNRAQLSGLLNAHGFGSIGSGPGSFTVPPYVKRLHVRLWGGGAGGGYGGPGAADGGSGAGYDELYVFVTPGQVISYYVAAGATGGTSSSPIGANGDTSNFGSFVTCTGGLGGNAGIAGGMPASHTGPAGSCTYGTGGAGYNQVGEAAHKGDAYTASGRTGAGGGAYGTHGGVEQLTSATFPGNPGDGPGAGGAGGGLNDNGGAGAGGILLLDW